VSVEPSSAGQESQPERQAIAGGVLGEPSVTRRQVAGAAGVLVGAWAVLTGLLILAGEGIEQSSAVTSLDRRITTFVVGHRTPALNQLMKAVTWTGSWIATFGVAVLVGVFIWRRRLPILALIAVLAAWFGELLAVTLTKAVVQRPRPPEALRLVVAHGWSFPSGHTANAIVVFVTAAAVVSTFVRQRNARVLTWAVAVLVIALVGSSRIELGVHWTTDVVASLVWTTCWLLILVKILGRAGPREVQRQAIEAKD
jgi:undecaprenyl-diphosphatase